MDKLTVDDVLKLDPTLDRDEVQRALDELQRLPLTVDQMYERDDPGFIHALAHPPSIDDHGLTDAMRVVNDFAEARGLPIPFPPK